MGNILDIDEYEIEDNNEELNDERENITRENIKMSIVFLLKKIMGYYDFLYK
jgi:hypothetical protein